MNTLTLTVGPDGRIPAEITPEQLRNMTGLTEQKEQSIPFQKMVEGQPGWEMWNALNPLMCHVADRAINGPSLTENERAGLSAVMEALQLVLERADEIIAEREQAKCMNDE